MTMRYYYIPIRKALNTDKSKILTSNVGEDVEQQELSHIIGGNAR